MRDSTRGVGDENDWLSRHVIRLCTRILVAAVREEDAVFWMYPMSLHELCIEILRSEGRVVESVTPVINVKPITVWSVQILSTLGACMTLG
jgi:hypothetical protein